MHQPILSGSVYSGVYGIFNQVSSVSRYGHTPSDGQMGLELEKDERHHRTRIEESVGCGQVAWGLRLGDDVAQQDGCHAVEDSDYGEDDCRRKVEKAVRRTQGSWQSSAHRRSLRARRDCGPCR